MGPSSFRKQSAGRVCLGMVVMREQRVQEDLRKQQWLTTSETLSSNAQLDPQLAPPAPTTQRLYGTLLLSKEDQESGDLATGAGWLLPGSGPQKCLCFSLQSTLLPVPSKRRHILVSTGAFPVMESGARAKAPGVALGLPKGSKTQLCFS